MATTRLPLFDDRDGPEDEPRDGAPWALLPEELTALGAPADGAYTFGRLQRPWTWTAGAPTVGAATRAFFAERARDARAPFASTLPTLEARRESQDGATKLVVKLADGARVEAVHMPRAVRHPRVTLCLSSQVGCAMGCTFCATAQMGLVRQMTAAEIVGQVLAILAAMGPTRPQDITLVFMGMGEPLHNLDNVARAVRVLCHPAGLGIAPSRITVSTSGLVPGIDRLAKLSPRPLLAVSLNGTTDATRRETMPVTKAWGLGALRDALARFPLRPHEKVTLEYVLLAGENDTDDDAERLAAWVGELRHNVNVIPYNAFDGSPFRETSEARLQAFVKRLQDRGCLVTVRRSRGRDVSAACGQLANASASA